MNRVLVPLLLACLMGLWGLVDNGEAKMEFEVQQTIPLTKKTLDLATSGDGKYLYILQEGGVIDVYNDKGQLQDSLPVGASINHIAASTDGSLLYLTDSAANTIQIAEVNALAVIDTIGSPYKGKADAPVVITIYSDFQ